MAYVKIGELPIGATHPNLGANQSADGIVTYGTLGENVTFGQLLYHNLDGKYYKAVASADETMPVVAMAVWTEASGKVCPLLMQGFVRDDSWTFMVGRKLYTHTSTAGSMTVVQPSDYRQIVGSVEKSNIVYFNPETNYHYGSSERITIKDLDTDVQALFERQQIAYEIPIWEAGYTTLIGEGKHVRLNVIDAYVVVGDNSELETSIEIEGITNAKDIAGSYSSGVIVPLDIIRQTIGLNEQIRVYASGNRRMEIKLICESDE